MAGTRYNCICIDLKSFYASVECVARGLDPLTTNLVVADESRTDKTICLAVSPTLKARGIPGTARLWEVKQRLREIEQATGEKVDFIVAPPHMQRYLDVSSRIYGVYLRYIAPEDIHMYSVDEAFIDVSRYLDLYGMTAHELAVKMIRDVLAAEGITATVGIGTNLYLAKIAMDIVAKHMPADRDGVRIAELDEIAFREQLWSHRPLTDFWMIGGGTEQRLQKLGIATMGDLAEFSLYREETLFKTFGVDAEILIDHAWGIEPCRMEDIKRYRPATKSLSSGQVLKCGYGFAETRLVVREMTEHVVLEMIEKGFVAEGFTLYVSYDALPDGAPYDGPVRVNHYGRLAPVPANGTADLGGPTDSLSRITAAVMRLFDRIVDPALKSKHLCVAAIRISNKSEVPPQMSFFSSVVREERETDLLRAEIGLHKRFGKSAVFRAHDLMEGATTIERNSQIGGHQA